MNTLNLVDGRDYDLEKAIFVETVLKYLLRQFGYSRCKYYTTKDKSIEFVKVYYQDNSQNGFYVDVTADSLLSLTRDVLNKL